jgi:hypothetical protein
MHMNMHARSKTLGLLTMRDHTTLVFSSSTALLDELQAGDHLLLYPHWYTVSQQGSFQVLGNTSVSPQNVARTPVDDWQLEVETLLDAPLGQRLRARQVDLTYMVLFDPFLLAWHEDIPSCFPAEAYVYVKPFFYHTDKQGRLQVLDAFTVDSIPPHEWASRFKQVTGIAEDTKVIPLPLESTSIENIEALWKSYKPSRN